MSSIVPRSDDRAEEPLVTDLADFLLQLDEIEADGEKLLSDLTEDQVHWSPVASRWSVAQCLVHLNIIGRRYLSALDETIERANRENLVGRGPFRYGFVERWIAHATEPPPGVRLRTPASARPPDDQPLVGVRVNFHLVQDELRTRVRAANGLDLARAKVTSPFVKSLKMGLGPCFAFLLAHERRHLWQAWRVRRHETFPPA
ncbi:MAG: DinB family protein [Acidobacteriia bacterium]|nr:DinB family protein [Terriglobia bacterium]